MLTEKGIKTLKTLAKTECPIFEKISYDRKSDSLTIRLERRHSDLHPQICNASYHLFIDQGYYICHCESESGPHDFAGMFNGNTEKAKEIKDFLFFSPEEPQNLSMVLKLLDTIGEYPCYIEFEYFESIQDKAERLRNITGNLWENICEKKGHNVSYCESMDIELFSTIISIALNETNNQEKTLAASLKFYSENGRILPKRLKDATDKKLLSYITKNIDSLLDEVEKEMKPYLSEFEIIS